MRKFRTPLARSLQKAFCKALYSVNSGLPIDETDSLFSSGSVSRRKFVNQVAKSGLFLASAGLMSQCISSRPREVKLDETYKIAIIGAGIAGLNVAYQLHKAGYHSSVYEASRRNGGRMFTAYGKLIPSVPTELGGEFIDSSHSDMLQLAEEFNLPLVDLQSKEYLAYQDDVFLKGRHYTQTEIAEAFKDFAAAIKHDFDTIPNNINYKTYGVAVDFDNLSLAEYLENLGISGWLYDLIDVAYTSEMGIGIENQSALNLITFINPDVSQGKLEIFGESDERYKVHGGNQLIIKNLERRLKDQIFNNCTLENISDDGQGYKLNFNGGREVTADIVVLTIPFTKLREVDIRIKLPPSKIRVINELSYGTNSKLMMGFKRRIWRKHGYSGYLFSDIIQNGWENSQSLYDTATDGGYTVFLGGLAGKSLKKADRKYYLSALEQAYNGVQDAYNDHHTIYNWNNSPFAKGSYSAYTVGQWTTIGGAEFEPVNNLYFAGEHCSRDFQGYMNGGAATGARVAREIVQKVLTKS